MKIASGLFIFYLVFLKTAIAIVATALATRGWNLQRA
jgi:hypothetical protein